MATIVRELVSKLGFDSAEATKDAGAADKSFDGLKKTLLATVAAGAAAAAGLLLLARNVASAADKIAKLSDQTLIARDDLQALQYSGQLAGFTAEQMSQSVKFLSVNLGAATQGVKLQVEAFNQLGVAYLNADGSIRPVGDVFYDIADAMQNVPDAALRARLGMTLLGRSGRELTSFLAQGSAELRRQGFELESLGGFMSNDLIDSSVAFQDNQLRLKMVMKGLEYEIAEGVLPVFNRLLEGFNEWYKVNRDIIRQRMKWTIDGIAKGFDAVADAVGWVVEAIEDFRKSKGISWSQIFDVVALGGLALVLTKIVMALGKLTGAKGLVRGLAAAFVFLGKKIPGILVFAAIGVALDELAGWIMGTKKTIIEDLIGPWEDVKKSFQDVGFWETAANAAIQAFKKIRKGFFYSMLGIDPNLSADIGQHIQPMAAVNAVADELPVLGPLRQVWRDVGQAVTPESSIQAQAQARRASELQFGLGQLQAYQPGQTFQINIDVPIDTVNNSTPEDVADAVETGVRRGLDAAGRYIGQRAKGIF